MSVVDLEKPDGHTVGRGSYSELAEVISGVASEPHGLLDGLCCHRGADRFGDIERIVSSRP